MRRSWIVVVVVAVLFFVGAVPVAAQPEVSAPTSWGAFAAGLVDWAQGVWSVLAGSESDASPAETGEPTANPDGLALDDSGETSFGTSDPHGEIPPALDPDG